MAEISPNEKVKPYSVKNWGKKYRPIRVWCCVVSLLHKYELLVIQQTYGQYCDNLLFFVGDYNQKEIENHRIQYYDNNNDNNGRLLGAEIKNIIYLPLNCTGDGLAIDRWEKNWKMYQYLYTYHLNEFEWIIRLDTDAWFSTPNFKGYAQYLDPDQPWYFGTTLTNSWKKSNAVFVAGGVTVLSRGSIKLLNRIFKTNEYLKSKYKHLMELSAHYCHSKCSYIDDVVVAQCLRTLGVVPMNTLDEHFRGRFFCFTHKYIARMSAGKWWYFEERFEKTPFKKDAMVEHVIGFHGYKDDNYMKINRKKEWLELNKKYIKGSILSWSHHPPPPKPVTFLFDTSFNDIDEYFNIRNPPKCQKIWKGVDNLWNYAHSI